MPKNAPPLNDPAAAKYSAADLARFVANYQPTRDAGSQWDYSNIGYWVLSEALAARVGDNFENLVRERVIARLGLTNTDFRVSQKMKSDVAQGHDAAVKPAPSVSSMSIYSLMPAAGRAVLHGRTIWANLLAAADGLRVLRPCPVPSNSLSTRAAQPVVRNNRRSGGALSGTAEDEIIYRDGGTYGFASSIAFDREAAHRRGRALEFKTAAWMDTARHLTAPGHSAENRR